MSIPGVLGNWGMVEVKKSPEKGLGVFAKQDIPQGTCILFEKALFALPQQEDEPEVKIWTYMTALRGLSKEQFAELLTLAENKSNPRHVYQQIAIDLGLAPTFDEVKAMSIIETNSYRKGLFLKGSRFNHSCIPNVFQSYNEKSNHMAFHTRRDIAAGEELLVSYIDPVVPKQVRKDALRSYNFECTCSACVDPDFRAHDAKRRNIVALGERVESFTTRFPDFAKDEAEAGSVVGIAREYVEACSDEPGMAEELIWAYQCFANVARKGNNAPIAAWACEQAARQSTIIRGKQHQVTRDLRQAAETLRSPAAAFIRPLLVVAIDILDGAMGPPSEDV